MLIGILLATGVFSQRTLIPIQAVPNATVKWPGDLDQGQKMEDLSWAWSSQNACFVSSQQQKFTGHHVLFQTEILPRAVMTIRVIPADPQANFSLYAYSGGGGAVVPDLPSCVSCEADYKWDFKYRGKTQDHTRSVELRAVNNPYPVTIGVVGSEGLAGGAFTLEVTLEGGETAEQKVQKKIPLYEAPVEKGRLAVYEAGLAEGEWMHDLSWAWSSQNVCFTAPQQDHFKGFHQLYLTGLPEHSELSITLVPDDPAVSLNLYAYSFSGDLRLVPDLSSCVSCEASFSSGRQERHHRKVDLRAVNHPYRVIIGVAGAEGVQSGKYRLELNLK